MNAELNLETELHSDAKLQNERVAHSDSKVSVHERDVEIPDRNIHSDSEAERKNEETRAQPRLSKYVRRHHPTGQIIGNKYDIPMARNRIRSESCFLSKKKPKATKYAIS